MSTRCNIILTDDSGEYLYFYKHSDGYVEHTLPLLEQFTDMIVSEKIRNNISQSSGWLIHIGRELMMKELGKPSKGMEWKYGYIEPTSSVHGDIEFLYVVNCSTAKISYRGVSLWGASKVKINKLVKEIANETRFTIAPDKE